MRKKPDKSGPPSAESSSSQYTFPIVAIGASAGGLAAFESFFTSVPANPSPGMAFIVVQHLAPEHKSALSDILSRYTAMAVKEASEGMRVLPNSVYIIPPGKNMELQDGMLKLSEPKQKSGLRTPIDFLFQSMARELQDRAICIVLSGTGSDGTAGLRVVKDVGGTVIVQNLDSAEYDGMPRSVLEAGLADHELLPQDMPGLLLALSKKTLTSGKKAGKIWSARDMHAFQIVLAQLQDRSGHDFSHYKPDMVKRRIERRLLANRIDSMADYAELLKHSPNEVDILFQDLLISVTQFFRDPETFQVIEQLAVPDLFSGKAPDAAVRIWVPGCATGEEAYSIAILVEEYREKAGIPNPIQIFASDIDSQAIAKARAGLFPATIKSDISKERLERFFTFDPVAKKYRINHTIRSMISFSEQSVIKDPPFSKLDLISCRNLLIYMNSNLQARLFPIFHYALNPGGLLVLGPSESLGEFEAFFSAIDRKAKIFRRKDDDQAVKKMLLSPQLYSFPRRDLFDTSELTESLPARSSLRVIMEQALLEALDPVAVLTSENGDIFYAHGHTGLYLEIPHGETAVANIFKMAREDLRDALMAIYSQVRSEARMIRQAQVHVRTASRDAWINLVILPIQTGRAISEAPSAAGTDNQSGVSPKPGKCLYMVLFEPLPDIELALSGMSVPDGVLDPESTARINALTREVQLKEQYLRSANRELEASNEELRSANEEMQSINEELHSTNEELETSKEELQSVNEELATVNAEMQSKITDLYQANNDMNNLLAGTSIATVFVDNQMQIKRFTQPAIKVINLIPGDLGRPIAHVVTNLMDYVTLPEDVKRVLDTLIPIERQVQTRDQKWYVMRIQPYRTIENVIEGAVITFVDITEIKKTEEALAFSEASYRRLFDTTHEGILIVDPETGMIKDANPFVLDLLGFTQDQIVSKAIWEIGQFKDIAANREKFEELKQKKHVHYKDLPLISADGRRIDVEFDSIVFTVGSSMIMHCYFRRIETGRP